LTRGGANFKSRHRYKERSFPVLDEFWIETTVDGAIVG
jgi:hypothetical protein